jgi:hypothetical protein
MMISLMSVGASNYGPPCSRRQRPLRGRQHGFDLQVEAINQHDSNSKRALANAQKLYASAEAQASAIIKQEEDLIAHMRQVNQQARDVDELER